MWDTQATAARQELNWMTTAETSLRHKSGVERCGTSRWPGNCRYEGPANLLQIGSRSVDVHFLEGVGVLRNVGACGDRHWWVQQIYTRGVVRRVRFTRWCGALLQNRSQVVLRRQHHYVVLKAFAAPAALYELTSPIHQLVSTDEGLPGINAAWCQRWWTTSRDSARMAFHQQSPPSQKANR